MNNNELLQKVLDIKKKYNRSAFGLLGGNEEYMRLDAVRESMQEYAEIYHAAKLAEVAQGECFTEDDVDHVDEMLISNRYKPTALQYLNAKAAAFAAAKVEGAFTEGQLRKAIRLTIITSQPKDRTDNDYYNEIINQLKESK